MGVLRVDHPDILEFITCKTKAMQLRNFNISVGVTDSFMRAVDRNEDYTLINPHTDRVVTRLSARTVFDFISFLRRRARYVKTERSEGLTRSEAEGCWGL